MEGSELAVREEQGRQQHEHPDELAELADSFSAFKTQLSQGHELKKLRREFERHRASLKKSRETYADNLDILARYDELVGEQEGVIEGSERLKESSRASIERAEAAVADVNARLEKMRAEHQEALRPEYEELYLRTSELTNANGVVKACKAERDSVRMYARAEEGSEDRARYERAQADLAAAEDRRATARSRQREAQRVYDAKAAGFERSEDDLAGTVEKQEREKERAEKELERLQGDIDAARTRIARCEHVRAHPDETEQLAQAIADAEAAELEMSGQIEQLEAEHAASKAASSRARSVLIALGVFAVIVVVVVAVIMLRGW